MSLKCVMILSDKSSGSSILLKELRKNEDVHIIENTRHAQNETLYWNKAAASLSMPQPEMEYSELPMSKEKGKKELLKLLSDNLESFETPKNDEELVFKGWNFLCQKFKPVFLEKSPHHLHYWSALRLINKCRKIYPEIEFKFIGLIRNPMDTLYSMWRLWGAMPERRQYEWLRAYKNMLKFKDLVGGDLFIVKYEDLVTDVKIIEQICGHVGIEWNPQIGRNFFQSSIKKWRNDRFYGFQLSDKVIKFAQEFYPIEELKNSKKKFWIAAEMITENKYKYYRFKKAIKKEIRKKVKKKSC